MKSNDAGRIDAVHAHDLGEHQPVASNLRLGDVIEFRLISVRAAGYSFDRGSRFFLRESGPCCMGHLSAATES